MINNPIRKNIPINWTRKSIDDIAFILKGRGLSKDKLSSSGGRKCILYGQLFTTYNEVIGEIKSMTDSDDGILSEYGDILIPGSTTTKAEDLAVASALLEDGVSLGGDINILRKKSNDYDPIFMAYYLTHYKKKDIGKLGQGSTIIHLYGRDIKKIEVLIPTISEQKKISDILSAVDKEIKSLTDIILNTEKLKIGLMSNLFIREKFPKTWLVKKLEEIATVQRGKFSHRPRNAPEFYGGSIPFIQTGDVVNSNGKISSYKQTLNEKGLLVSKLFKKGTIVITIAANIGDTGILEFDSCFPDSLIGITPSEEIDAIFLEYYLRTQKVYLNSIATQSAQKNINLEKLNPLPVLVPPKDEQKRIALILSSVDEKIATGKKLKTELISLKKGLMSDLFIGKVRTINH